MDWMTISDWSSLSVTLKSIVALVSVERSSYTPRLLHDVNQSMVNLDKRDICFKNTQYIQTESLISVLDTPSVTPSRKVSHVPLARSGQCNFFQLHHYLKGQRPKAADLEVLTLLPIHVGAMWKIPGFWFTSLKSSRLYTQGLLKRVDTVLPRISKLALILIQMPFMYALRGGLSLKHYFSFFSLSLTKRAV